MSDNSNSLTLPKDDYNKYIYMKFKSNNISKYTISESNEIVNNINSILKDTVYNMSFYDYINSNEKYITKKDGKLNTSKKSRNKI